MDRDRKLLTRKHNFIKATIFYLKSSLLSIKRMVVNILKPTPRFVVGNSLRNSPIIGHSESDLWNKDDTTDNWIMTAGKIQNLRIAAKRINGLEVKTGEIFSFWKQLGNPNFGKGYVIGREIREGCVIPTIGGGLCQLSNALYDAAIKSNFDIIERHKHTDIIKGSLAEQDRDATVKWNHVDLRFRSDVNFRIEIDITSDKLIVVYRSNQRNPIKEKEQSSRDLYTLNDCYSCGNTACYIHNVKILGVKHETAITTYIVDEKWPEFDEYVKNKAKKTDCFIVPIKKSYFFRSDRYSWSVNNNKNIRATTKEGLYRLLKYRLLPKANIFKLGIILDEKIARHASKLIPIETTHLVVSQNLLPSLVDTGAFGGRSFDVLMTRLPIETLQARLDAVHAIHKTSTTLNDFRASQIFIDKENLALSRANLLITPNRNIAEVLKNKTLKLEWVIPKGEICEKRGEKILYPASLLARKGAHEIKRLSKELNITLVVAGTAIEKENFREDINIESFDGDWDQIGLVVYPTYVEHQPRKILKAISKGIPVIVTNVCGIDASENVRIIEIGDYEALKKEVLFFLSRSE